MRSIRHRDTHSTQCLGLDLLPRHHCGRTRIVFGRTFLNLRGPLLAQWRKRTGGQRFPKRIDQYNSRNPAPRAAEDGP